MKRKVKKLRKEDIPASYKGNVTSVIIISNLYRFINYIYLSDVTAFRSDYKKLLSNAGFETESKLSSFSQKFRGVDGRLFKLSDAEEIARVFGLPDDSFIAPEIVREVAYVFLECPPSDILAIFDFLKLCGERSDIVDECSLIAGDADIFLRLYGTKNEIRMFISK